jgi:PPK2 family polyphosphate:nucleotide phosphotransferase
MSAQFEAVQSPYLVPHDGSFRVETAATGPPHGGLRKKAKRERLGHLRKELGRLQRVLYADNRFAVLTIFQAMDAGGKDGTIRAVMTGVNPAGCQVFSFKKPSVEELDHDFLWRTSVRLPERGRIGVFNRSYYEEVLVVRVHPQILGYQRLPRSEHTEIWEERFESIREEEEHLARNGIVILKFWLNVSREEQRQRFLARLENPEKHWKFSTQDVEEREHWDDYMLAYEEALNATSRPWAPWYAIPAVDKPYMRLSVAEIVVDSLRRLPMSYPAVDDDTRRELAGMRERLLAEDQPG